MTNAVLADNAAYCPGSTAVDGLGLFSAQVVTSANYVEGNLNGPTIDHGRFFNGGSANRAFTNPAGAIFWLAQGSILRNRGDVIHGAALDFNNTARTKSIDVGAYQINGLVNNPGWAVQPVFKSISVRAQRCRGYTCRFYVDVLPTYSAAIVP